MLFLVKILIVAIAVIGQAKLFPEGQEPVESELERTALPEDQPELVLARRAMLAEGLCPSSAHADSAKSRAHAVAGAPAFPPAADTILAHNLAENCF